MDDQIKNPTSPDAGRELNNSSTEYLPSEAESNQRLVKPRYKSKQKCSRRSRSSLDGSKSETWFKAIRSEDAKKILRADPYAFLLLYTIADRAQRTDAFNIYNLKPGQALIGDYWECGIPTERKYRTAKKHLTMWGKATFKSTSLGTIATLTDTSVFDINIQLSDEQNDGRATNDRRASDEQATNDRRLPRMLKNAKQLKECEETKQHSQNSSIPWEERE